MKEYILFQSDNVRRFALWRQLDDCPNQKAWMGILDSSDNKAQPCSWDQNVQRRPYFLYSNKATWAQCERGNIYPVLLLKAKQKYRGMFETQKVRKHDKFRKEWSQH